MIFTLFSAISVLASSIITPAPVPAQWWQERHEKYVQQAQIENFKVVFLGDSITDLWRNEGHKIWEKNFVPLSSVNFGIGGDGVQNLLWRVQNGELEHIAPKAIVVLIGTNNLPNFSNQATFATQTKLITEIRNRQPNANILLLAIFPRNDEWSRDFRKKIEPLNAKLKTLADGKTIHYLDLGSKFKAGNGEISRAIMYDGLHLTEAGYQIWSDNLLPVLEKLL